MSAASATAGRSSSWFATTARMRSATTAFNASLYLCRLATTSIGCGWHSSRARESAISAWASPRPSITARNASSMPAPSATVDRCSIIIIRWRFNPHDRYELSYLSLIFICSFYIKSFFIRPYTYKTNWTPVLNELPRMLV